MSIITIGKMAGLGNLRIISLVSSLASSADRLIGQIRASTKILFAVACTQAAHKVAVMKTRDTEIAYAAICYFATLSYYVYSFVRETMMCWWLVVVRKKMWWWIASFGYSFLTNQLLEEDSSLKSEALSKLSSMSLLQPKAI